jgi:hypothetical protein
LRKRVHILLALGLVASLIAGAISVSADHFEGEPLVLYDAIYAPWVPSGDFINGEGPYYGTVTVQNLDPNFGVRIFVFNDRWIHAVANIPQIDFGSALTGVSAGVPGFAAGEKVPTYLLPPSASQTLSAGQIGAGIGYNEYGSGVKIVAVYNYAWIDSDKKHPDCGDDRHRSIVDIYYDDKEDEYVCVYLPPMIAGVQKQVAAQPFSGGAWTGSNHITVDGYTLIPFVDVSWGSQSDFCHDIVGNVDWCDGAGFYLSSGLGFNGFNGHSYGGIVQTNDGWNTEIYVTNVDFTDTWGASVDVELITTDQQGYGAPGQHRVQVGLTLRPGQTQVIDVSKVAGPGWVGSAWITSEVGIVVNFMRSKPSTHMLMINTSAPSLWSNIPGFDFEIDRVGPYDYEQYAPLIFAGYNGWNTGISFVNIAEQPNRVSISFYGPTGNAVFGGSRTVSPKGQEFIYIPHHLDLGLGGSTGAGWVGSAVFQSDLPFHIVVDQVKYDDRYSEAISYLGTAAGAGSHTRQWPALPDKYDHGALMMPLVQKATQHGGGDISGLQIFNAHASRSASFDVWFFHASGAAAAPTIDGPINMTLAPLHNVTIYTLTLSKMAQGSSVSAVILPVGAKNQDMNGQIVGVSNNVNYDVNGDGSAGYNMVNAHGQYRFPLPGFWSNLMGD